MATTIAAMKGRFGSTDYYVLAMKAKELMATSSIPSEIPGWKDLLLEEKEQRDINYNRVKRQIAPYLASDPDRFFGAVIVMAKNFDPKSFEPIQKFAKKDDLPHLYEVPSRVMGFLTLSGDEALIPLDGQHRLKAIKFASEGLDEKSKPISGVSPNTDLLGDDVTVLLIPYDDKKARKIFTKVNKYARPTTTGQNLVTDDDDIIAVLSRAIANDKSIIGTDLVKYTSNTLNNNEAFFTTLATIAECNASILQAHFCKKNEKIDREHPVEDAKKKLYEQKVREVWSFLVEHIKLFAQVLEDKSESGHAKRREIRRDYLLGKPAPQFCLVDAFARLTTRDTNLSYKDAAKRLNKVNWSKDAAEWDRLFVMSGRILTSSRHKKLVTDILYYRAGGKLLPEGEEDLLQRYRDLFPADDRPGIKELPPKL